MSSIHSPLHAISNGFHSKSSGLPCGNASNANATVSTAEPNSTSRACTCCGKTIISEDTYRWCENCRVKDREKSKRKKERARERAFQGTLFSFRDGVMKSESLPQATKTVKKTSCQQEVNSTSTGNIRSPYAPGHTRQQHGTLFTMVDGVMKVLPGPGATGSVSVKPGLKSKPMLIDEHTSRLGKRKAEVFAEEGDKRTRIALRHSSNTRMLFQTESGLLDALSAALQSYYASSLASSSQLPYINFHGTYSIIADPRIKLRKRVEMLSAKLKKTVKLPHSGKTYIQSISAASWMEILHCDCSRRGARHSSQVPPSSQSTPSSQLSQSSRTPGSSQTTVPLKRAQSKLSHWILSNAKSTACDATASSSTISTPRNDVPGCGGRIYITAVEDGSHPLGFKGQKIDVIIEHPSF
ncbi:hypothetical protein A0H81_06120 [Grifola frondosa]|uniref:Uncharacterized protein n=1 Tax=Grifola frondosa TaxID=5627 RepID=A0A1C7MBJ5_GRIFR|nr:hypothetical protein A0H81_06120 [Grifola frondosa]